VAIVCYVYLCWCVRVTRLREWTSCFTHSHLLCDSGRYRVIIIPRPCVCVCVRVLYCFLLLVLRPPVKPATLSRFVDNGLEERFSSSNRPLPETGKATVDRRGVCTCRWTFWSIDFVAHALILPPSYSWTVFRLSNVWLYTRHPPTAVVLYVVRRLVFVTLDT